MSRRELGRRTVAGRDRRIVGVGVAALAIAVGTFAASTIVRSLTHAREIAFFDHWLYNAIFFAAAAVSGWRALTIRRDRAAWALITTGIALYAAGGVWTSFVLGGDVHATSPSIADVLNLAFYPFAYLGLVLLARPRIRKLHTALWLDGAIAALGASAFVSAVVIERVMQATSRRFTVVATTLAYPVCDLVLLCTIATVASLCSWRLDAMWRAILVGITIFSVADLAFAVQQSSGAYREGTPLDVGWPAGFALIACAAFLRGRPARTDAEHTIRTAHIMPALFTLGAIALLAASHEHRVGWLSVGLAVATLLAAMLRTAFAFRELWGLTDVRAQAITDDLTGLGNRRLLMRRLADATRLQKTFSLLVIDLDGFKEVNDALGRATGDDVLVATGRRLSRALHAEDLLVRLGGDEYAIYLDRGEDAALDIARQLADLLNEPFEVSRIPLRFAAAIGIVCAPRDGTDPADLLRKADIATYRAKRERSRHAIYESRKDEWGPERLALAEELRAAIEHRELAVLYQPKALVSTGLTHGVEALVRWDHPERGLLGPGEFVPLAEQSGLMHAMTMCVLEQALSDVASLRTNHPGLTVAVNVSVATLLRADLPGELDRMLAARELPPSTLEIEITEDALMTDAEHSRVLVGELRRRGIAVAIDDYGTGYSSLRYLRDLEVDWLKIDQSFVTGIGDHDSSARIVESTIRLAHALGLRVVAEGVEDSSDWNALSAFGCDAAQGYFLARPLRLGEISEWLDDRHWEYGPRRVLRAA